MSLRRIGIEKKIGEEGAQTPRIESASVDVGVGERDRRGGGEEIEEEEAGGVL